MSCSLSTALEKERRLMYVTTGLDAPSLSILGCIEAIKKVRCKAPPNIGLDNCLTVGKIAEIMHMLT